MASSETEFEDEDDEEDDDPALPRLSELVAEGAAIRSGDLSAPDPWWRRNLGGLIGMSVVGVPAGVAWAIYFPESFLASLTIASVGAAVLLLLKWVEYKRAQYTAAGKPLPWWARQNKP